MNMQVMNADGPGEVAWAIKLRATIGKYLGLEEALDAQRASPDRVQSALADVLVMADGEGVRLPANLLGNRAKSQMWQALLMAARLRCGELENARRTALPPRLPSPYSASPVWPFFVRMLEGMRHKAWPPDVRAWFTALIPAVEAYLVEEARFALHAPSVAAVADLRQVVADALQKIDPPAYQETRDVPLRVHLRWKTERSKKMLTDTMAVCRSTLLLRQGELAQMTDALAAADDAADDERSF